MIKSVHHYAFPGPDGKEVAAQVEAVDELQTQHNDDITHIVRTSLSPAFGIVFTDSDGIQQMGTVLNGWEGDPEIFDDIFRGVISSHLDRVEEGSCECDECGVDIDYSE